MPQLSAEAWAAAKRAAMAAIPVLIAKGHGEVAALLARRLSQWP